MKPFSLFIGDSGPLIEVKPESVKAGTVLDDNWICRILVLDSDRNVVVPVRVETSKSENGESFIVSLTSAETELFQVADGDKYSVYKWVIQISNDQLTPAYSRETFIIINAKRQGI